MGSCLCCLFSFVLFLWFWSFVFVSLLFFRSFLCLFGGGVSVFCLFVCWCYFIINFAILFQTQYIYILIVHLKRIIKVNTIVVRSCTIPRCTSHILFETSTPTLTSISQCSTTGVKKGRGMCYHVCGMVHIKEPLLLIDKSSLCAAAGFLSHYQNGP